MKFYEFVSAVVYIEKLKKYKFKLECSYQGFSGCNVKLNNFSVHQCQFKFVDA
jgi:hypothetical protein